MFMTVSSHTTTTMVELWFGPTFNHNHRYNWSMKSGFVPSDCLQFVQTEESRPALSWILVKGCLRIITSYKYSHRLWPWSSLPYHVFLHDNLWMICMEVLIKSDTHCHYANPETTLQGRMCRIYKHLLVGGIILHLSHPQTNNIDTKKTKRA